MSKGLVFQLLLALVAFLIMLNGHLRGVLKPRIDAALGLCWLVLLAISLWNYGWKAALATILLSFLYGALLDSLARKVAARLLRHT